MDSIIKFTVFYPPSEGKKIMSKFHYIKLLLLQYDKSFLVFSLGSDPAIILIPDPQAWLGVVGG